MFYLEIMLWVVPLEMNWEKRKQKLIKSSLLWLCLLGGAPGNELGFMRFFRLVMEKPVPPSSAKDYP